MNPNEKQIVGHKLASRRVIGLLLGFALLIPTYTLLLSWSGIAAAVNPDELLPVEQAFKLSAETKDAQRLRVQWDIADGYYLYRERFKFTTDTPGVTLGTPNFPAGKKKTDEFFGEMEIYRHQVSVDIPVTHADPAVTKIKLNVVSQGCADVGVCYPPQTQKLTLSLPAAVSESKAPSGVSQFLNKLGAGLGLNNLANSFLEPDKAFAVAVETKDGNTLVARWQIAKDYYLYRDKFAFRLVNDMGEVQLGAPQFPPAEPKTDETMGKTWVYHDQVAVTVPLQRSTGAPAEIHLEVKYQGCAEAGFCYPPITKTVSLELPATASLSNAALPVVAEQDRLARVLTSGHTGWALLTFFGLGLLLAFTPCVFPMIPILSSIIVGQHAEQNPRKAFVLSLVYVLAMAFTYTVLGVIAGRFGENLQAASQNPWILGSFSAVFVVLAFSMFGLYQLQIPARWQTWLSHHSNRQQSGTLIGVAVMGLLSALIVGPCVAAPLAAALIVIGQSGDAVLGGMALFSMSLGMGVPLLLIGTSLGRWLPATGGWMNTIKAVFGVLLLAVAIWMLERILPAAVTLLLWGGLLSVSAIYMGALDRMAPDATGWRKLWKGVGFVMLVYGAALIVGAASGGKDVFQPLQGLMASSKGEASSRSALAFKPVKGIEQLQNEIAAASAQGRPVMLDFYADWCVACKELEKFTFSDLGVQQALSGVVLLRADVTANDELDKALLKQLGLIGPPSILFFDPNGQERAEYRLIGFLNAEKFLAHVRKAVN
ncbi:MAG: protein-disulfide reductase DsbD [Gammaproteobacteria bacterium]